MKGLFIMGTNFREVAFSEGVIYNGNKISERWHLVKGLFITGTNFTEAVFSEGFTYNGNKFKRSGV